MFVYMSRKNVKYITLTLLLITCLSYLVLITEYPPIAKEQIISGNFKFEIIDYTLMDIDVNISTKLNKLRSYWTSNENDFECNASMYKFIKKYNCLIQFDVNHLFSLGFQQIDDMHSKYHIKTMHNIQQNSIGCYGLNIYERASANAEIFQKLYSKTKSYSVIMAYCIKHNLFDYCKQWLPITHNLQDKTERINFFSNLECGNGENNEWIIKNDVHKGEGIHIITNINYLRNFYLSTKEQQKSNANCVLNSDEYDYNDTNLRRESVAQQLILNTHKIKGCNFHLRVWLYLANYYNPTILLYAGIVVFRATNPDEMRSNRHWSKGYRKNEVYNDWAYNVDEFGKMFNGTIDIENMIEEIKNISSIIVLSAMNGENTKTNMDEQHYIPLVLDFIITTDNQLKFLDLNLCPGFFNQDDACICFKSSAFGRNYFMNDKWPCVLGRNMAEEIIDIELEIAIKRKTQQQIREIESHNNFEIIVWK